ncbi:MAG: arginine repressor [Terriglobales bacterium]
MNKTLRQRAILELLKHALVASQEDLQKALRKRGIRVGQATLSRDIRDLGLSKTAQGYALPPMDGPLSPALPPASRLIREFVLEVRVAQNLLVLKTSIGSAQPVAAALDDESWPEVVGDVAGDDTILIVCTDNRGANKLAARIQEMLA